MNRTGSNLIDQQQVRPSPQKRVLLWLSLIGMAYFLTFLIPNSLGVSLEAATSVVGDEAVTYPVVVRMLTPGETFNDTRANLFLYEDYHYGYPFYAYSALVLLPVRLIYGSAFTDHLALNLLLLRQFVSLLPMIIAAGVMVYLQTRFLSLWKSLALFLFLLSVRGIVRNDVWWWHPDALTVLCVVLTLFFLARDRLRFGRNFYLAAVACGLATAIKLLGVFFFLTIPGYLLAGWLAQQISIKKMVLSGALFVTLMCAVVVVSNPFLFSNQQRTQMLKIQAQKQEELTTGYSHDDPIYYSKGPQWWVSTLSKWYASPLFLGFLFISVLAGCIWGPNVLLNRLILSWVVPYSIYLFYFVAVKPDHYWLPVMLPLFSGAFNLVELLAHSFKQIKGSAWQKVGLAAVVLALVWQFSSNLFQSDSGNVPLYYSYITQKIK